MTRWSLELAKELEYTIYGILCIVPDNVTAPWLIYEAGALSKSVAEARVCPLLFGVTPDQLPEPLVQFQATLYEKEDLRRLMRSINEATGAAVIPEQLDRLYEFSWPGLQARIDPILDEARKTFAGTRGTRPEPKEDKGISEEHVKVLEFIASADDPDTEHIAHHLDVPIPKAEYYIDALLEGNYIDAAHDSFSKYPTFSLQARGRALLVKERRL